MPVEKKLKEPVTVTTIIEKWQWTALRNLAFMEHKSQAEIVREALEEYLKNKSYQKPIPVFEN
jgi:hypothetical protein